MFLDFHTTEDRLHRVIEWLTNYLGTDRLREAGLTIHVSWQGFGELGADNPDVTDMEFHSRGASFKVRPNGGLEYPQIAFVL